MEDIVINEHVITQEGELRKGENQCSVGQEAIYAPTAGLPCIACYGTGHRLIDECQTTQQAYEIQNKGFAYRARRGV
jgi:hypothetical protein